MSRRRRDETEAGCLYDGTYEVQEFTPEELAAVEAAAAPDDPMELVSDASASSPRSGVRTST